MIKIDAEKLAKTIDRSAMSVADVARAAGVGRQTVYRALRGEKIKRITAGKIAKALNVNIYEIQAVYGMTVEQVTEYLDLINRRLYILTHSGIHWKPEYAQELAEINQKIEALRPTVEQARKEKEAHDLDRRKKGEA